jgi:hypothetical protein
LINNDTLKVTVSVQQIITELSEAMSEKDKLMVITEMILNKTKWVLEFKAIEFNANGIWRQRY